ncbi:MAG: hypothetical protein WBW46_07905 [Candidatus Sulfotelmatobacter sp.]
MKCAVTWKSGRFSAAESVDIKKGFSPTSAVRRLSQPIYNDFMAETKPFRLTESVKAAG